MNSEAVPASQTDQDQVATCELVEVEALNADSVEDATFDDLQKMSEGQKREAEQFALEFLRKVIRLKGVKIDRTQFLTSELQKRGVSPQEIQAAVDSNLIASGIGIDIVDKIAKDAVDFETRKSSAISFASGLPGGFTMLATVPADVTQFYVHAFRVMQKLAYTYGWQDFLGELDEVDDETMGILVSFLGVMMGVAGASQTVSVFAVRVAQPAVQKKIAAVALTKTAWYPIIKKTLGIIGIQVTKSSFAKATSTVVPVVGGFVAGSLTFVTLSTQSKRLRKYLRQLPPPNVDASHYASELKRADELNSVSPNKFVQTVGIAGKKLKNAAAGTADKFRQVDLDGDGIPDEAVALTKAKDFGGAIAVSTNTIASNVSGKLKRLKGAAPDSDAD